MAQSEKYVITKGSNSGFSVYEIIEFERECDNVVYTYHTYKYAGRSKSLDNLMRKYPEATLELDRCRRGSYTVRVSRRFIDITLHKKLWFCSTDICDRAAFEKVF